MELKMTRLGSYPKQSKLFFDHYSKYLFYVNIISWIIVVTSGFHPICRYACVNHDKVMWDVSIFDVSVNFPWRNTASEYSNLVTPLYFQTIYCISVHYYLRPQWANYFIVKWKVMPHIFLQFETATCPLYLLFVILRQHRVFWNFEALLFVWHNGLL